MDTSEEFIKMCEKSVEVQELWCNRRAGDICASRYDKTTLVVGFNCGFSQPVEKNYVWLPRQDQLQEMVIGKDENLAYVAHKFWKNINCESVLNMFTSMEQLWLAFVMFEKYQKSWNGTDWVKKGIGYE